MNPGIGGLVQPQAGATQQGLPPTDPQAHQELSGRWQQFFTNPAVQAGLFQFGASMLANVGSNRPTLARVGLAAGDAGRAVGGAAKFQADQQSEVARQGAEQTRLQQGQQGINLEQSGQVQRGQIAGREAALRERELAQTGANAEADRALKERELLSSDNYRKLTLALQEEQLQAQIRGTTSVRERMLTGALKNIQDTQSLGLVEGYDPDKAAKDAITLIDTLLGSSATTTPPPNATPQAGAPTPTATGAHVVPANAMPIEQAIPILKANPTPENVKNFDTVYGPGAAAKAGISVKAPTATRFNSGQ